MGQETTILNSELAVKIMSAIASRTDGDYSTNLADELDKSQPSISRVLNELHNIGFIEKGKREKAQYYVNDYEQISDYWFQKVRGKLEEKGRKSDLKNIDENSEQLKKLASRFFKNVLEGTNCSGITVSRIIFDGFAYSVGYSILEDEKLVRDKPFLKSLIEGLKIYTQEEEFCGNIYGSMARSVEETFD